MLPRAGAAPEGLTDLHQGLHYSRVNDSASGLLSAQLLGSLHAVQVHLEKALEPLGLSLAKFGVLSNLAEAGEPLPLSALAERQACVRSNITQLIDRLEAERLVLRTPDPHDRRSVRAQLTDEGQARRRAGLQAVRQAEAALFEHLPAEEREWLMTMLRGLQTPR